MRQRAMSEGGREIMNGLGIDFFPIRETPRPVPHHPQVSMRSYKGMQGLADAELGGSMVELDPYTTGPGGSGFRPGQKIGQTSLPSLAANSRQRSATLDGSTSSQQSSLVRHPTLLNHASLQRNATELKSLLGSSGRKLTVNALAGPPSESKPHLLDKRKSASTSDLRLAASSSSFNGIPITPPVSLEKAKQKARVEVDLFLESETVVEGGELSGKMEVCIRKAGKNELPVWIGGGKLRLVGFEAIPNNDTRHTFYQYSLLLSEISASCHLLYASAPDAEGFCRAREGTHILPFSMKLPTKGPGGIAKGSWQSRSGAAVRYIAMGSIKLKTFGDGTRSIAHFYRHIEIYPCLDPSAVLATLEQPLQSTNSQTVFLGGSGKVKITAILHRRVWVAGQRCYLKISINNHSTKKIKSLALTLNRNVTVFQPNPDLDPISSPKRWGSDMLDTDGILPRSASEAGELAAFEVEDYDACQTSTSRKQVAECTLELGQKGERGCVTAKGWWTGVEAGASVELSHFILIPPDALSITRGRLLEVDYSIKVAIGAGSLSSDIHVNLPIRVINFLSIDPPPTSSSSFMEPSPFSLPLHSPRKTESSTTSKPHSLNGLAASRSTPNLITRTLTKPQSLSSEALEAHNERLRRQGPDSATYNRPHIPPYFAPSMSMQTLRHPARYPLTEMHPGEGTPTGHKPWVQPSTSPTTKTSPFTQQMPVSTSMSSIPKHRGRDIAKEMFGRSSSAQKTALPQGKSVAFADEWTTLAPVRRYGAPLGGSASPVSAMPRSSTRPLHIIHRDRPGVITSSPTRPQLRNRPATAPNVALSTSLMKQASTSGGADDEFTSESGYSDNRDDERIYGEDERVDIGRAMMKQGSLISSSTSTSEEVTTPFDRTPDVGEVEEFGSPILRSEKEGDMSRDGNWEIDGNERVDGHTPISGKSRSCGVVGDGIVTAPDRSFSAAEMMGNGLKEHEHLLDTTLPQLREEDESFFVTSTRRQTDSNMTRSQPFRVVNPDDKLPARLEQAQEWRDSSRDSRPTPILRTRSAFAASTPSVTHHKSSASMRESVGFVNKPSSTQGVRFAPPRFNSAPKTNLRKSRSSIGFSFPHEESPLVGQEDPTRWSGVVASAQVVTMSRAPAVTKSSTMPAFTAQSSSRGNARTVPLNINNSPPLSPIPRPTIPLPTDSRLLRPHHRSTLSSSSASTDSSLRTRSSETTSSSYSSAHGRVALPSVQNKIAQLEARSRALRAFSTPPTRSG